LLYKVAEHPFSQGGTADVPETHKEYGCRHEGILSSFLMRGGHVLSIGFRFVRDTLFFLLELPLNFSLILLTFACSSPDGFSTYLQPVSRPGSEQSVEAERLGLSNVGLFMSRPGTSAEDGRGTHIDEAVIGLIDGAAETLDVALYDLDDLEISEAIIQAANEGVEVRVVSDGDEADAEGMAALIDAGLEVELRRAGDRIMHHKFIVADEELIWTGSVNLTHNGLYRNNNHGVLIESQEVARDFTGEFEQMFVDGHYGSHKEAIVAPSFSEIHSGAVATYFAPQHDVMGALVDLIDEAEQSIHFMIFAFSRTDVADALIRAHSRGVRVIGVMDEGMAGSSWAMDEPLASAGIPIAMDGNHNSSGFAGGKLHHKVLVVDGMDADRARWVTGSANWSTSAANSNDENMVILAEPGKARAMVGEVCRTFRIGTLHPDYRGPRRPLCVSTTLVPELGVASREL
jgi:phosphatidylserine/phosphatidylglycerophosphate/cardiolipin synthase-like enzyme